MDPGAVQCHSSLGSDPSPNPLLLGDLTNHEPDFGSKYPLGSHYVTRAPDALSPPFRFRYEGREGKEGLARLFSIRIKQSQS